MRRAKQPDAEKQPVGSAFISQAVANELLEACVWAVRAMDEEKVLQANRGESVHVLIGIISTRLRAAISKAGGQI